MKLREIVYDIIEALKQYSDDSDISEEYVKYLVHTTRAMLIQQRYSDRSNIIPNKIKQVFDLSLTLADDNPFNAVRQVLVSTEAIQKPIEPYNLRSGIRISSGDYADTYFNLVSNERFPYVGSKWVKNQIYVTIGTDYKLYFKSELPSITLLENVRISIICENPEEAYPYSTVYNSNIDFMDMEYPMEDFLIVQMNDIIIKKLANMLQVPEDKTNNDDDS